MSSRTTGMIMAIAGFLVALLFALADVIGVGRNPGAFGYQQLIGTAAGVLVLIVGGANKFSYGLLLYRCCAPYRNDGHDLYVLVVKK